MSKVYIVTFNIYRSGYGKCESKIEKVFYQLEGAQNYIKAQGYRMLDNKQSDSQFRTMMLEYTTKYIIEDHNVMQ